MEFPAYAEKWVKLQDLRGQLTAITADIAERLTALAVHPQSTKIMWRRAQLLGDTVDDVDESALDRGKLSALCERRNDLVAVIEELERRLNAEQGPIDAEICARLKPEHDQLAHAMCKTLIALQAQMKTYRAFTDRLNSEGIAWSGRLRPAQLTALGDPIDKNSRLAMYLDDMARHGIVSQAEIPAEIRHERPPAPAPVSAQKQPKPRLVADSDWSAVA